MWSLRQGSKLLHFLFQKAKRTSHDWAYIKICILSYYNGESFQIIMSGLVEPMLAAIFSTKT